MTSGPLIKWTRGCSGLWLVSITLDDLSWAQYRVSRLKGDYDGSEGRPYLSLIMMRVADGVLVQSRRDEIAAVLMDLAQIALDEKFGGKDD